MLRPSSEKMRLHSCNGAKGGGGKVWTIVSDWLYLAMSVLDDFRYTIMRRERARLGWKGISKERQATTKDWPVQNCQFDIDLRLRSECCGQPDLGRKSEVKLRTKTTSPRYVTLLQRGRRKRLVWMRPRSWKKSQKPNQLSRMYTLLISANLACVWWAGTDLMSIRLIRKP